MRLLIAILIALPTLAQVNRTVTVKPSGGDYTSLAAAIAGEKGNLVTLNRQLTIECHPMEDTSAVVISAADWTVDATRYILITTPSWARHSGMWTTSAYRLNVAATSSSRVALTIGLDYVRVVGLQVGLSTASTYGVAVVSTQYLNGDNVTIDSCIIRRTAGTLTPGSGIALGNYPNNTRISNNLIYGLGTAPATYGINVTTDAAGQRAFICNNTIHGTVVGVYSSANRSAVLVNNLVLGNSTTDYSAVTWGAGTNYNVSSNSFAPGASVATGKTSYADYFNDHVNGDFHLKGSSSSLFGLAGSDLSGTFGNDIDQQTREEAWDIGADEFTSAGRRRSIVIAWRCMQPWCAAR